MFTAPPIYLGEMKMGCPLVAQRLWEQLWHALARGGPIESTRVFSKFEHVFKIFEDIRWENDSKSISSTASVTTFRATYFAVGSPIAFFIGQKMSRKKKHKFVTKHFISNPKVDFGSKIPPLRSDPYVVCFLAENPTPVFQTEVLLQGTEGVGFSSAVFRKGLGCKEGADRILDSDWNKPRHWNKCSLRANAVHDASKPAGKPQVCRQTLDPVWDEAWRGFVWICWRSLKHHLCTCWPTSITFWCGCILVLFFSCYNDFSNMSWVALAFGTYSSIVTRCFRTDILAQIKFSFSAVRLCCTKLLRAHYPQNTEIGWEHRQRCFFLRK